MSDRNFYQNFTIFIIHLKHLKKNTFSIYFKKLDREFYQKNIYKIFNYGLYFKIS